MPDNRYRFTVLDLERVAPSQLRPGDLIAHAGPPGSGLFCADPVTSVGPAGYSPVWRDQTYRVEYRSPWACGYFVNPDLMRVSRLTESARARYEAE